MGAKQIGGTNLLDGVWRKLGLDKVLAGLLKDRHFSTPNKRRHQDG
jgi:hypothetical protein